MTNLKQEAMTASGQAAKRKERANALQMDDGPTFDFGEVPSREKVQNHGPVDRQPSEDDRPCVTTNSAPVRVNKQTKAYDGNNSPSDTATSGPVRVNKQTKAYDGHDLPSITTSSGPVRVNTQTAPPRVDEVSDERFGSQFGKGKGKGQAGEQVGVFKKKSNFGPFARFARQHAEQEMKWLEQQMKSDPFAAHGAVHTSRKFMEACVAGDLTRAREIEETADESDWLQDYVYLSLKHGVETMNAELVKMLVNDMALPLSTHRSCKTHLHDIVERTTEDNFPNAVRLLTTLSQGNNSLDIDDIRTSDFYTPLCVAVKNGMPPLVYHLLELGAVVNVMTKSDETPLSIAMNLEDGSPLKKEAKLMITQMLKSYGALGSCKEIMTRIRAGTLSVQPRKAAAVTSAESIPEGRRLPEEDDK